MVPMVESHENFMGFSVKSPSNHQPNSQSIPGGRCRSRALSKVPSSLMALDDSQRGEAPGMGRPQKKRRPLIERRKKYRDLMRCIWDIYYGYIYTYIYMYGYMMIYDTVYGDTFRFQDLICAS